MKLGDQRITKEVCCEKVCDECGEPAKYKHTYLLNGARSNPASSAYRKDDCSWCEDECAYACEEHKNLVERNCKPNEMSWCSTFYRERFEHMFLFWKKSETVEPENNLTETKLT